MDRTRRDHRSTISDAEDIQVELIKYVYGVFDYIKNSGKFEASSLTLDWIAPIPGKRESRRVYGDYVLTQNDIDCARRFEDAVAYGGWTMDAHTIGGLEGKILREKKRERYGIRWTTYIQFHTDVSTAEISKTCMSVAGQSAQAIWH